ncbi:DUF1992 domain-containing protein [Epibacterium sp. SM1979]|uniref:DUF1992 domain-containing protein n=1 Tax=Tritonibacter litoralis TaxID=2662264 RepID=A0A843Y8H9_9RHOB|nr:DnaJ family domain-containing protein [Tritonibacter litoralis]MQQ07321.1 DUF1992 domain-containing protein [Tritonibacter litoralis]
MKWRDLAEQQIQKAKSQGQLDNLAGEGQPLEPRAAEDIVSAGMGLMAQAGVVPREIELKKAVDAQRLALKSAQTPEAQKAEMRKLADLELRLNIEQEARRKFYRTS